ncbi:MAG: dihydropteroate synthase [Thermoanaerobacterales bacterium]|nr:dihydropteroate synthase [Bacillota bacterium]MDI6906648.1 dihydropteroate synthase [Thermoanaerobacterales bacterium]
MILIGERINGMFRDIRESVADRDKEPVAAWARRQAAAGAHYLDINTGPGVGPDEAPEVMAWLVRTAQDACGLPCCLDSPHAEVLRAGLETHRGRAIINSTSADQEKMDVLFPLAVEYGAAIIGLAMNEKGVPKDANDRLALAMELVANADAHGLAMDDLFIDPLILPVNVAQEHAPEVLETLRGVKLLASPAPLTVVGLSNVSQRAPDRPLINRTFAVMAVAAGLDAAILDVEDADLLDAIATARVLMNKEVYCDSYLKVFRAR